MVEMLAKLRKLEKQIDSRTNKKGKLYALIVEQEEGQTVVYSCTARAASCPVLPCSCRDDDSCWLKRSGMKSHVIRPRVEE